MNRMEEYQALLDGMTAPAELEATVSRAAQRKRKKNRAVITALAVACLLFGVLPFLNREQAVSPLIITVYSYGEDGDMISKKLELGEKVKLYPAVAPYGPQFSGYAFDLTLLGSRYVYPCAVDENWEPKLYKGSGYTSDDFHWSLSEGNDIIIVRLDKNGDVVREGEYGGPKPYGSEIIWRPNDDGLSRTILKTYDSSFRLTATYYLEITDIDGDYYAEIVKIVS